MDLLQSQHMTYEGSRHCQTLLSGTGPIETNIFTHLTGGPLVPRPGPGPVHAGDRGLDVVKLGQGEAQLLLRAPEVSQHRHLHVCNIGLCVMSPYHVMVHIMIHELTAVTCYFAVACC